MKDLNTFMNEGRRPVHPFTHRPVMYSIYNNINGPWCFGYLVDGLHENCVVGREHINDANPASYGVYPELIVPFEKFDPFNMKENVSWRIRTK